MKITLTKQGPMLLPYNEESEQKLAKLSNAVYVVDIKNLDMRTVSQNNALHLWATQISERLNAKGIYVGGIFNSSIEWNMELVKELIIKQTIRVVFKIESTTQLKRKELDDMIDYVVMALSSKIEVPPFPSRELWNETKTKP